MKQNKSRGIESKTNKWGWGFVALSIAFISLFVFYPTVQSFITSLQSGMGNNLSFVGFANYTRLMGDATFKKAVGNTFNILTLCNIISCLFNNHEEYICFGWFS